MIENFNCFVFLFTKFGFSIIKFGTKLVVDLLLGPKFALKIPKLKKNKKVKKTINLVNNFFKSYANSNSCKIQINIFWRNKIKILDFDIINENY